MKTLMLRPGEIKVDEEGEWHGMLVLQNSAHLVSGTLTYCMYQFRMHGSGFVIRTPNPPADPGKKETNMDYIKLNEKTIREAFNELKIQARNEWRPKGFYPMDDYKWYIEIKAGTATMYVTFTIVDKGTQHVSLVLNPSDDKTKAEEPSE